MLKSALGSFRATTVKVLFSTLASTESNNAKSAAYVPTAGLTTGGTLPA
jgi:hypothetical protein